MIKYLQRIAIALTAILIIVWRSFVSGKNSVINEENKEVVKSVENLNKIKQDVSHLSDSDLDKRMSKWTNPYTKTK